MRGASIRSTTAAFIRERAIRPLLPDAITTDLNRNDRVGALHRAWGHVFTNSMKGGYYEFGVYRGDAFRASIRVHRAFAKWLQEQRSSHEPWRRRAAGPYASFQHHFYAFDTFEGIPDNQEGNQVFANGNFACSWEEFSRLNRKAGITEGPRIQYFKGTFEEIRAREADRLAQLQPAAIVNIDCDLYASARDALQLVAPKLVQGSVLLVDDWNTFAARGDRGERRAVTEFLERHPDYTVEPWFAYEFTGQAFLVHWRNSSLTEEADGSP